MHDESFPSEVVLRQGSAVQPEWEGLLTRAREIGASVTPFVVEAEASRDNEMSAPVSLSQQDFLVVAGEDRTRRGTANKAWAAALMQRRRMELLFESSEQRILLDGLVFEFFANKVAETRDQISQDETLARQILKSNFGRSVTPEIFEFWREVVTFFTPPQRQSSEQ